MQMALSSPSRVQFRLSLHPLQSLALSRHNHVSPQPQSQPDNKRHSKGKPKPAFMPATQDDEERYVLTLYTNSELHEKLTALRTKYFPKHLNKLAAHMTLFHALPGSKLESDVIPQLKRTSESTKPFPMAAGPPFEMTKGIGIAVRRGNGGKEARDIHEELLKPWRQAGFLSEQDSRNGGVHYTIMNKVDDSKKVDAALKEVSSNWEDIPGTAVGLALWHYDHGYWKSEKLFPFKQ